MDGENRVLARAVMEHRNDISKTLQDRRQNRAMRRRVRSRRRRLRDFRALLAEMEIPPQLENPEPGEIKSHGNRLYALAHWRGWDWAELEEMLAEQSDDKPPRKTETVRMVDDYLKQQLPRPPLRAIGGTMRRGKSETPADFQRRQQARQTAAETLARNEELPPELLRHAELQESCLGEFSRRLAAAQKSALVAAQNPDDEPALRDALEKRRDADELRERLHNLNDISEWIGERLQAVFAVTPISADHLAVMRGHILALLGLEDGRDAFLRGNLYRPHRNRHRKKAEDKLRKLLRRADRGEWFARARAVLNCPYRVPRIRMKKHRDDSAPGGPPRRNNRNIGKCPARNPDGGRCGKNVPMRAKPEVRELLFLTEARQMNIQPRGETEHRKLHPEELRELTECADFVAAKVDKEKWDEFFSRFRPRRQSEENRSKREALLDIAAGTMPGRAAFCAAHLREKDSLLRDEKTEGAEWAALHQMRILGPEDAPPSLRCKVDAVCARVLRMAKDVGVNPASIARIGVESARFDIASLSSAEGRKLKKSAYGKKRPRVRADLAAEQDNLCAYCGQDLAANWTIDHVFPRAAGGGDAAKNRVAACAACNMEKWQFANLNLHPKALDALRRRNPEKAKFLEKSLRGGRALASAKMSAAHQTMTGGKILRAALARALFGGAEKSADLTIFPVVRAADSAMLRRRWFPQISRQKSALRDNNDFAVRVDAGKVHEEKKILYADLRPETGRLPAFIQSAPDGKIRLAPNPGDEGVYRIPMQHDIRRLSVLPANSKKRNLGAWEAVAGKEREIDLAAANVRGLLIAINGEPPTAPDLPLQWQRDGAKLTVRADAPDEHELAFASEFRVTVRPPAGHPAHTYHHAADAIVIAAALGADWEKIVRMEREAQKRHPKKRREFWRIADSGIPRDHNGHPYPDAPPENEEDFLFPARSAKGGHKTAKTGRNPLALAKINGGEFLVQRVPLDRLSAKSFHKEFPEAGAIVPASKKIRDALRDEWRKICELPSEQRDEAVNFLPGNSDVQFIAQQYLLKLRPGHILNPARTRSVQVVKFQDPRVAFVLGRGKARHRFERQEHWGEVVQWKAPDGQTGFCRRRPKWYRNKLNSEWDDSPEKGFHPPPDGANIIARFRRGLHIACEKPGLWRIAELGQYASLVPANAEARRTVESAQKQAKPETIRLAGTTETPTEWRTAIGDRVEWEGGPGVWKVQKIAKRIAIIIADDSDSRRWMRKKKSVTQKYALLRRV